MRDPFWQNFSFQQRPRLGVKEGPKKGDVKSIRFDLQDPTKVTAGIFHGRSRLRARGLIDTDVTDTLTTLNNLTALLHRFVHLRERERERERERSKDCVRLKTGLVMVLKAILTLLYANRFVFRMKRDVFREPLEKSSSQRSINISLLSLLPQTK